MQDLNAVKEILRKNIMTFDEFLSILQESSLRDKLPSILKNVTLITAVYGNKVNQYVFLGSLSEFEEILKKVASTIVFPTVTIPSNSIAEILIQLFSKSSILSTLNTEEQKLYLIKKATELNFELYKAKEVRILDQKYHKIVVGKFDVRRGQLRSIIKDLGIEVTYSSNSMIFFKTYVLSPYFYIAINKELRSTIEKMVKVPDVRVISVHGKGIWIQIPKTIFDKEVKSMYLINDKVSGIAVILD